MSGQSRQPENSSPASLGVAALEAFGVGELERHVEASFELAAIMGEGQARFERHRFGRDRIAPAQFDRVGSHGTVDRHPCRVICDVFQTFPVSPSDGAVSCFRATGQRAWLPT
jgi:hypothetical protein